jgi:hypothetical protein
VSGYQVVSAQSAVDSSTFKSVTATCPAGKTAISGTARIQSTPANADLALQSSYQSAATNWIAEAAESDAVNTNWSVTVTAICVTLGS